MRKPTTYIRSAFGALVASTCLSLSALPASAQDGGSGDADASGYVLNAEETRDLAVFFAALYRNQIMSAGPLVDDPNFLIGLEAALLGTADISDEEYRTQLTALSKEMTAAHVAQQDYDNEVRIIEQTRWIAEKRNNPDAAVTRSGVVLVYQSEGLGEVPPPDATVKVHYHGTLSDGTVFVSSINRGPAETLALPDLIDGWREAMASMPVGSVVDVYIPADLAYRDRRTGAIPPHSAIAFRIHLLEIVEGD